MQKINLSTLFSIYKWIFSRVFIRDIQQIYKYYTDGKSDVIFYCVDKIHINWILSTLIKTSEKYTCALIISGDDFIVFQERYDINKYNISLYGIRFLRTKIVVSSSTGGTHPVISKTIAPYRVHMPHSIVSFHLAYPVKAFRNFNVFFCCGYYHNLEIMKLNNIYYKQNNIIIENIGYGKLDTLKNNLKNYEHRNGKLLRSKEILIAPSWGEDNVFQSKAIVIIDKLISEKYKIVLRPHIASYTSDYFIKLKKIYENNTAVHIEDPREESRAIYTADLIISDFSGIAFEYIFLRERPALFLNVPLKCNNKDWKLVGITPIEISLRNELGKICDLNAENISEDIKYLLLNIKQFKEKIIDTRNKYIFNYGECSTVATNEISSLLDD